MLGSSLKLLYILLVLPQLLHAWSTSTTLSCTTRTNKRSATTKTITATHYRQYIDTVTISVSVTVPASTSVVVETETIYRYNYYTTETSTIFYPYYQISYITSTVLASTTSTVTSTAAGTTVTAPTPSGFTPIASVVTPPVSSAIAALALAQATGTNTRVICHEKVILTTVSTSTTTAPPSIITETTSVLVTYSIVTTVQTVSGSTVSVTVELIYTPYYYTTLDVTDTDYLTTTKTATSHIPTATSYAACASNNVFHNFSPGYFIAGYTADQNPLEVYVDDAYSCCAECFRTVNCTGMAFYDEPYYQSVNCYLFLVEIGDVCNGSAYGGWKWYYMTDDYYSPGFDWWVSNGPCGQGGEYFFHYGS